jgi:class 3 adenylate cyclase
MLSNMLPKEISHRIQNGEKEIADEVEGSVVFIDLCDYNKSQISAKQLVNDLNEIFQVFDKYCSQYGIEKIKTIGDSYMAVCTTGSENTIFDYAIRIMEMIRCVRDYMDKHHTQYKLRIGVATGMLIQGVLSGSKLSYDVWSDTVNVASRLQHLASAGQVYVCARTYAQTHFKYHYSACNTVNINAVPRKNKQIDKCQKQCHRR